MEHIRMTLSKLAMALMEKHGGDRGRDFVREFSAWFQSKAAWITLEPVERLGLKDVAVTLSMRERVTLVAVGYADNVPGEVSIRVDERDFPMVWLRLERDERPAPYSFCTLDYLPRGHCVRLTREVAGRAVGTALEVIVHTTVEERRYYRVNPGAPFNVPEDAVELCEAEG